MNHGAPALADDILFVMATEQEYGAHLRRRFQPTIVGVGPIEASIGTALALERRIQAGRKPALVVSLGSAGSHRCAVGSIWQVSSVSWRDMDASRLGFEKGVTPFCDHPAEIVLPTPLPGLPTASLSTGGQVIGDDDYLAITADLVDMETFAVARACQRFDAPMIGLRGVSDGPGTLTGIHDWAGMLDFLDEHLAAAVDLIPNLSSSSGAA